MVVDTGGLRGPGFDVGKRVVGPYLRRLGISKIDILALSHPDTDHIGGARALVEEFNVEAVWLTNSDNAASDNFQQLLTKVKEKNIPIKRFMGESAINISPGVMARCFAPKKEGGFRGNDAALVIKVSYGQGSVLLPGDIKRKREASLAKRRVAIGSDVLVVPHHGAKGSSTRLFIKTVRPLVALCSCGYKNMFHHPANAVVERYKRLGVTLFRTDVSGTLDIKIARDRMITVSGYYMKGRVKFSPKSI